VPSDAIDGVGFVDDDTRHLMVLHQDGTVSKMSDGLIKKHRLFMYFSHADITGIDTELYPLLQGEVTLSHDMTLRDYFQAVMRLRLFGEGQTIRTLVPDTVVRKIRIINGISETETLTTTHILKWLYQNSKNELKEEIFTVTPQKLKAAVRRFVMDKVLENPDLGRKLEALWVDRLPTRYVETHLSLQIQQSVRDILERYKTSLLSLIPANFCSKEQFIALKQELDDTIQDALQQLPQFWIETGHGLDKEMQCVAQRSRTTQREQTSLAHKQKQVEGARDSGLVPIIESDWEYARLATTVWESDIVTQRKDLESVRVGAVKFLPLQAAFKEIYDIALDLPNLLATDHFLKAHKTYDGRFSKLASHVVEIQNRATGKTQYMLVSNQEADGILRYLRQNSAKSSAVKNTVILRDFNGTVLAKNSQEPQAPTLPTMMRMVVKFLNSDMRFSPDEKAALKQWALHDNDPEQFKRCFDAIQAANKETMGPKSIEDLWT